MRKKHKERNTERGISPVSSNDCRCVPGWLLPPHIWTTKLAGLRLLALARALATCAPILEKRWGRETKLARRPGCGGSAAGAGGQTRGGLKRPLSLSVRAAGRRDLARGKFGGFHKEVERRPQISQATEGQHLQKQSSAMGTSHFHFFRSLLLFGAFTKNKIRTC